MSDWALDAELLRRRVHAAGGRIRRRNGAVYGYFGISRQAAAAAAPEIAAALAAAGVEVALDAARWLDPVDVSCGADGPPPDYERESALPDLVDQAAASVVHIFSTRGSGSGFVFDRERNLLVTNAHVVGDDASVKIKLQHGAVADAAVKGRDVPADVAVIATEGLDLPPLRFKPQRNVRVGDRVLAVGSPLDFEWSVTAGIVSAKDRAMSRVTGSGAVFLLQTDASTTHGNSGGPLLAMDGRVVGMACSGFDGVALNFAVPSDTIVAVAEEIARHGEVKRSALGLKVARAAFYGAEADRWGQDGGALVLAVTADRPAAQAGVQPQDVILSFDGQVVDEPSDLLLLLDRDAAGRPCELAVIRGTEALAFTVTPG